MSSSSPKRGPGRPRVAVLTRDDVCTGALALLARRRIGDFTMRALANELEVDPMALYRHFDDKERLLEDAARFRVLQFAPRLPARGTWRERVVHFGLAYARFVSVMPDLAPYTA